MTTKTLVNASCERSYKDKKAQKACLLFEKITADTQQLVVKQPQSRSVFEMSNGSPYVLAQIEKMEKKLARFDAKFDMLLQRIPGSQVAVQQPLQAACSICSITTHDFFSCPHKDAYPEFTAEQVNQQDRSKNTAEATAKNAERVYVPPMPYLKRLKPKAKDQQLIDFMKTLAKVQINLPLIDAIENIPSYAKFLKDVCTKKEKLVDFEKVILTEQCSAILLHKLPPKKKDPGSFTISCTIGNCDFSSALIDLGASVNLMPYSVFKRLGEGELKPTSSIIQLADRSITYPRGVIEDVIVKVDNLYLPVDFMVLDMDEDLTTPIILGRPFLGTARTLIDVEAGTLTFRGENQTVVFRLFEAITHPGDKQECMRVDALDGLPRTKFVTRSSTDNLPIKTQNVIHECDGKAQHHKIQLLEVQKSKIDLSN
ncbi:uncharacterized protein LOC125479937 [Pyrus x bretschneideri]|uniref:uncharacterized protein LOC125479937 n=1 Tax=Pyrus x bretschneideri TaxID=225117 RepID=UPI00202FBAF6|nr:uncharacterized protein LOC125479937 [Pyrus x bretschneideri]